MEPDDPRPTTTGYVDTEGLHLYYETYGPDDGTPLVLLHGGVLSIHLNFDELIALLAGRFRVIALDQQAHGRSNDTDRDLNPANLARDVVALLDHLGIEKAHVLGHSMGAAVTLQLAVAHGDRLLSAVPISGSVRPSGRHPDFDSPEAMAASDRMPGPADFEAMQAAYAELSPTPDGLGNLMAKMGNGEQWYVGWSDDELAAIAVPVLIVFGDHDFTTIEHAGLMLDLIPGSTLAVLPGTNHMEATHRVDLLGPALAAFWGPSPAR